MKIQLALTSLLICITLSSYCQEPTHAESSKTKVDTVKLSSDSLIFRKVEKESDFTGGTNSWKKFLEKNLDSGVPVFNGAPVGTYTVIVVFIVSKDGTISDIMPLTHCGYGMEKEVVRILKLSPKWTPGFQRGRAVNSYRRQPVTFVVEDN